MMRKVYQLALFSFSVFSVAAGASASASEESDWLNAIAPRSAAPRAEDVHAGAGVIRSDVLATEGEQSFHKLRTHAEANLKSGNYEVALMLLDKALDISPTEIDARILHAQALQMKYQRTRGQDPELFEETVREWLYVSKKAEFLEERQSAESRLMELTGRKPKFWESSDAYMKLVTQTRKAGTLAEQPEQKAVSLSGSSTIGGAEPVEPVQVP